MSGARASDFGRAKLSLNASKERCLVAACPVHPEVQLELNGVTSA